MTQVVDPRADGTRGNDQAQSESGPDDRCTAAFAREAGSRLLRRELTAADIAPRVAAAAETAAAWEDFYAGLELTAISLLVAPEFLFRLRRVLRAVALSAGFRTAVPPPRDEEP